MSSLSFGGIVAQPGETTRGRWRVLELSDGSWAELPVMIVNGAHDGPVVYLGALMHGDEYSGIGVLHGVAAELDPAQMRGAVIFVPVQNPIAHRDRGRLTLIVQSDTTNMHRVWPGAIDGDSNQRMARLLFEELCNVQPAAVLDFHSGTTGHECAAHTFVPANDDTSDNGTAVRSFELAQVYDLGVVMRATGGAYSDTSWMESSLCANGIPAFGVELGEGAAIQPDFVDRGVNATLRLLHYLGILDGPRPHPAEQRILVDEAWVRAGRGGFVTTTRPSGVVLKRGEPIGYTVDVFGDVVEEYTAPANGYLLNLRKVPVIAAGERICRIGLETPRQ